MVVPKSTIAESHRESANERIRRSWAAAVQVCQWAPHAILIGYQAMRASTLQFWRECQIWLAECSTSK